MGSLALIGTVALTAPVVSPAWAQPAVPAASSQSKPATAKRSTARPALRGTAARRAAARRKVVRMPASPTDPVKDAALVIDGATGKVLYARNENATRYPASLTKMMTLYMLFEALKAGKLTMQTPLPVSAHAQRQRPTKLNLRKGQTIAVEDAIRATVIRSANDVAVVIAEALGGTEGNFALQMTAKARSLGMNETNFHNASGLPSPLQITTATDMAILGRRIAYDFPQHFHYFALPGFTYKGTWYPTHDNLIGRYDGADGIKTGYTNASGFNLVSSVVRDNRHIVAVVMGGRTAIRRDLEMIRILDEAFGQVAANPTLVASRPVPWHAYGGTTPVVTASLSVSPQAPAQSLPQSLVTPPRSNNPFAGLMAMAPPALGGPKFVDEDSAERKVASDEDGTVLSGPIARQPAVPNAVVNGPVLPAPNMVRPLARTNVPSGPIPAIRPSPRPDFSTAMVARNMSVVPAVRPSPRPGPGPGDLAGVAVARNMSMPPPPQPRPSLQAVIPEGDTDTPQPVAGRNWTIQIGAYADQALARAQLAAYADKARDVLGQASRIVTPASSADGKTVWRARFGLFGEDQAREVCSRLSQRGQTCFAAVAAAR